MSIFEIYTQCVAQCGPAWAEVSKCYFNARKVCGSAPGVQGCPRGLLEELSPCGRGGGPCPPRRAQKPQRAQFIHLGVTCQQWQLTRSSEGRDFTYLLPCFFCLFVLFSSSEEDKEGGASTRTGLATSEPQHQKPFSCSIKFIGKSVSLGGGVSSPVTHHEKAH